MNVPQISQESFNYLNFILGIIGSITGLGALSYSVYRNWKESPRIKIKYRINWVNILEPNKPLMLIEVINYGNRSIKVKCLSLCQVKEDGNIRAIFLEDWLNPVVLTIENPNVEYSIPESVAELDKLWFISISDFKGKIKKKYFRKSRKFWKFLPRMRAKIKNKFRKD